MLGNASSIYESSNAHNSNINDITEAGAAMSKIKKKKKRSESNKEIVH